MPSGWLSTALKTADQLLKKNPNHGDTEAMKALVINSLGNSDEGKQSEQLTAKPPNLCNNGWFLVILADRNQFDI